MADSVTDESSKQLTLLSSYLSLGHSISVIDVSSQQDSSDVHRVESSTSIDNPITITYEFESQDGLHSQNELSELGLTAALLHLSTSDTPVLLKPHAPLGFPPNFSTSPFLNVNKYYIVIRSKCTSIYYGEWYIFHHESSSASLIIPSFIQE